MFDSDRWREIGQTLKRHKLRTILTAFGVSWGIFMLIILLGMGNGLERGVMTLFSDSSENSVWIQAGKTSIPYHGLTSGRQIKLELDDLTTLSKLVGIKQIAATKVLATLKTLQFAKKVGAFEIHGVESQYTHIEKLKLTKGRNFNELDDVNKRKVAIIGERVYEVLFKLQANPIGETVLLSGIPFRIIGVYNKSIDEQHPNRVYIPLSTLRASFEPGKSIDSIALTVDKTHSWQLIRPQAIRILANRHHFDTQDASAFDSYDIGIEVNKLKSLLTGIRLFIITVGIGTLLAGCVGVSNTMLVTVKERTREFGIRKAIGASPNVILIMILQETLVVTVGAGLIGLVAGVGFIELIRQLGFKSDYFQEPYIDITIAVSSLLVLVIAGLIAGYLPARQAVNINPIEALRHE